MNKRNTDAAMGSGNVWRTVVGPSTLMSKGSRSICTVLAIRACLDPRGKCRGLASRMRELDANLGTLDVHKVDDPFERRDLRVRPEPGVLRGDAAFRQDRGRLHNDSASTARRESLFSRRCVPLARSH